MPEGRGSLSGRNGYGRWTVCATCRLRIQYVPTHGSKGNYRSAGPLAQDASTAIEKVKGKMEDNPTMKEQLNTKMVSNLGAQESLKKKMEKLQREKASMIPRQRPEPALETPVPKAINPPEAKAKSMAMVTAESKKAHKRESQTTPEATEASEWVHVQEESQSPPLTDLTQD